VPLRSADQDICVATPDEVTSRLSKASLSEADLVFNTQVDELTNARDHESGERPVQDQL